MLEVIFRFSFLSDPTAPQIERYKERERDTHTHTHTQKENQSMLAAYKERCFLELAKYDCFSQACQATEVGAPDDIYHSSISNGFMCDKERGICINTISTRPWMWRPCSWNWQDTRGCKYLKRNHNHFTCRFCHFLSQSVHIFRCARTLVFFFFFCFFLDL